jgi:hypothetical protein
MIFFFIFLNASLDPTPNGVTNLLSKIELNRSTERKVMPCLLKVPQVTFLRGTTRQEIQRRLGQSFPSICNMYLPDEETMGGCDARQKTQGGSQPI